MRTRSEQPADPALLADGDKSYVYVVFLTREDRGKALVTLAKRGRVYSFRGGVYELSPEQQARDKADYPAKYAARRLNWGGYEWAKEERLALSSTPEEREAVFEALWAEGGFAFGSFGRGRDGRGLAGNFLPDERDGEPHGADQRSTED